MATRNSIGDTLGNKSLYVVEFLPINAKTWQPIDCQDYFGNWSYAFADRSNAYEAMRMKCKEFRADTKRITRKNFRVVLYVRHESEASE